MTAYVADRTAPETDDGSGAVYDPVLRWMLFTGVVAFAAVVAWRYGLVRLVAASDRTRIVPVIVGMYGLGSLHNLTRAVALSREAATVLALRERRVAYTAPPGLFGEHLRALALKARPGARLDPTLLLRVLAERLSAGLGLGDLIGDILLKLGLLGTIVGFILMLGPIAGIDADDPDAVRAAMRVMSEGMGIAMFTTLAGLVGALLLRAQYAMLEAATNRVFWDFVRLTETRAPTEHV
jgi:hypothetical protein